MTETKHNVLNHKLLYKVAFCNYFRVTNVNNVSKNRLQYCAGGICHIRIYTNLSNNSFKLKRRAVISDVCNTYNECTSKDKKFQEISYYRV